MADIVKHLFAGEASWHDWRYQWRNRLTDADQVLGQLGPRAKQRWRNTLSGAADFRFAVTPYYFGLADKGDPNCPILQQVMPDPREAGDALFTDPDPLREEQHMPVRGLTHRYPDRVLWYLSANCAVYCRFCMRKRKVARGESVPTPDQVSRALEYIGKHSEVHEVILSGGDPLALSDRRLADLLQRLRRIEHLDSIRIHTRMPVTMPMRFTPTLLAALAEAFPLTLVTHFNHERELAPEALDALRALREHGVMVLNQSVLLSGVNDTVEAQRALLRGLLRAGVKPYYLHQCDEVRGVSHFRVPLERGRQIMRELRGTVPGIALPTFVVDLPGGGGKIPAEVEHYIDEADPATGLRSVRNYAGDSFQIRE